MSRFPLYILVSYIDSQREETIIINQRTMLAIGNLVQDLGSGSLRNLVASPLPL